METPSAKSGMNRFFLKDYSPAEIAALPDEPLLWWLTWQAMGNEPFPTQTLHGRMMVLPSQMYWPIAEASPKAYFLNDARPSLEAILDAIHKEKDAFGGPLTADSKSTAEAASVDLVGFYKTHVSSHGETPYLAACRALLAFKRGRG